MLWHTSTDFSVYHKLKTRPLWSLVFNILVWLFSFALVLDIVILIFSYAPVSRVYTALKEDFPGVTLQKGYLSAEPEIDFKFVDKGEAFSVGINTGEQKETATLEKKMPLEVLFVRDGILTYIEGTQKSTSYPFFEEPLIIDSAKLERSKIGFWVLLALGFLLFFTGIQMISFLFYALFFSIILYLGFVITNSYRKRDSYLSLFKICLLVNGPAFLYSMVIRLLGMHFSLLFLIVYSVFLFGALLDTRYFASNLKTKRKG